jgi:protein involved in polysaccharide export with SLBB domain
MRPLKTLALFALCLAFAAGVLGVSAAAHAQTPAPVTPMQDPNSADYKLGPGDKIRVITYGEESLTGEFHVGSSGKVAMPLIGEIQAAGSTGSQFQNAVESALKSGFLRDPKVSVEVLNYRPFYILGEVQKPGEYPYTSDLTVRKAVATANGFTYRANQKKVFIKHANSEKEESYPLNANTPVQPGDTIRIAERWF